MLGQISLGWGLNDDVKTLPEYLVEIGYESVSLGIHHVSSNPTDAGFETAIPTETARAREVTDALAEFLRSRSADEPFFATVGFKETHRPFNEMDSVGGVDSALDRYESDDPEGVTPLPYIPDTPGVRRDLADMHGLVDAVDDAVGDIRELLHELDLTDETLLIFTTDHGIPFPRAKGMCYDPGLRTALIFHLPGVFDSGKAVDELLVNVDLVPTLLEYLGIDVPADVDGRSFLPLVSDQAYEPRDGIFFEMTWHGQYNPIRGIRTEQYRYVRNFWLMPGAYIPVTMLASHSGEGICRSFLTSRRPEEELYDLKVDSHEETNVISDPKYRQIASSLRERVQRWMRETNDPLLDGPVEPPEIREFSVEDGYYEDRRPNNDDTR